MELVDIYNNKHEKMNYTKGRKELEDGEYRLSCFVWIINIENQLLIQQRLKTAKTCPNMWETASGGATAGDNALQGALRELNEELGIKPNKKNIRFIGSFARVNDFVEVFLLKSNINITELIDWVKRNNNIANEKRVRDAYNTGLALFQILKDCGWKVCNIDDRNDIHCYYASQIFFDREHTYIYKDLEFSPYLAYVSTSGSPEYRMIKEECRDVLSNRVYVRRIHLDVTTGVMYCDGIHPNVNRGSVCMGDIKGKITLSTATKDTVIKMLKDCEELLTVCNYTSPYNHDAEHLFKDPAYSIPAFQTKVETPEETSDSTKDIEKFNEDDIQLISDDDSNDDENATQDVQNDIVESEFDEITEENQHET